MRRQSDRAGPELLLGPHRLDFCQPGESKEFVESGAIARGGVLPVDTNGGLIGEGYLHGMNLLTESVRQLRVTAVNQVKAELVLMSSGVNSCILAKEPHGGPQRRIAVQRGGGMPGDSRSSHGSRFGQVGLTAREAISLARYGWNTVQLRCSMTTTKGVGSSGTTYGVHHRESSGRQITNEADCPEPARCGSSNRSRVRRKPCHRSSGRDICHRSSGCRSYKSSRPRRHVDDHQGRVSGHQFRCSCSRRSAFERWQFSFF